MSQAATICKSNFKVSSEAGKAACGREGGRRRSLPGRIGEWHLSGEMMWVMCEPHGPSSGKSKKLWVQRGGGCRP